MSCFKDLGASCRIACGVFIQDPRSRVSSTNEKNRTGAISMEKANKKNRLRCILAGLEPDIDLMVSRHETDYCRLVGHFESLLVCYIPIGPHLPQLHNLPFYTPWFVSPFITEV